ncbi:MAG: LLM class flavin-dependent oxidoreductase [Actinomycetota bacterium]
MRTGLAIRDPLPWHELVLTAELAERTGYETLFVPEIAGREAFSSLAGLARATYRLRLGPGVIPLGSRSHEVLAMGAATVQELSQGRFILGLGAGTPGVGSLDRVRDAVAFVRVALVGKEVHAEGDDESFKLTLDPGPQPVPIWLAALGPKMMRLAGGIADGVLLNWCPPERVSEARRLVHEGAEAAGRDPADVTIGVYVRACVGQEESVALPALREAAAGYVGDPAYRRQFESVGLDPERIDDVVRAVCAVGDAVTARAHLGAYREAGADVPVVYPVPVLDPVSSINGTILALAPAPAVEH